MSELVYPNCYRRLFEGEVFGEAIMLPLVQAAKTDHHRYCFLSILQLETETKSRLRPLLVKNKLDLSETADLSMIPEYVEMYKSMPWPEYAKMSAALLEQTVSEFKAIAESGPDEDADMLNYMVEHEASICKFFAMEARGETDSSIDDVVSQLKFPIPLPAQTS